MPDILSLSKLKILIISHNRIQYLDLSVFKFNQELEYLDLSHNNLEKISCHPTLNLKHLDLSFNPFDALPICQEFGNMSQLEFLGLSATQLQKSSVQSITRLHISKVLLVLGDTYGEREDAKSLQDLKTQSLHIVFPAEKELKRLNHICKNQVVVLCSFFHVKYQRWLNIFRIFGVSINKVKRKSSDQAVEPHKIYM